jgi:p-hydroxybenzoate 3-monooxygenase
VWRAEYFSNFMTQLLHREPLEEDFDNQLHLAQLRYVASCAASRSLAENYTGAATGSVALAKSGLDS